MLNKNMNMDDCIIEYVKYLRLLNKSEVTIKSYINTLQKFTKDEEINEVNEFIDMDREFWFNWVDEQKKENKTSIATINKKIKQMSSFYNFLVNEKLLDNNCLYRFPKINESTLNSEYKGDKAMSEEEAKAILDATDTTEFNNHNNYYMNLRDKLIVMVFLNCGLRIDELSKVQIQDIEFENNKLYVRGKGKKGAISRYTNFNDRVKDIMIECINCRPNRTYLFETIQGDRLLTQGIRKIWYKACDIAKVKRYVPHSCRHFLGSELTSKNVPINKVAMILGHSNISTSQKYYIKPIDDFNDDLGKIDIF